MTPERYEVSLPTSFESVVREVGAEAMADAPTILGIGVDTAVGMATGAGGLALVIGGYRLLKTLARKDRRGTTRQPASDPFPHDLDHARQLREIREYTERRVPEYDAAVGRIVEDEYEITTRGGGNLAGLKEFLDRVRERARKLMPPSTRQYQE